jgi:hypothetical protein
VRADVFSVEPPCYDRTFMATLTHDNLPKAIAELEARMTTIRDSL